MRNSSIEQQALQQATGMEYEAISVSLGQLVPGKNVRRAEDYPSADVSAMASSILSLGLLQNLVVSRSEGDSYAVHAGGLRFAGLLHLKSEGRITADFPVRCLCIPAEQAITASAVENLRRVPMSSAQELQAFARLRDEGLSNEAIAAAFGIHPAAVARRLKLASVSPRLQDEFARGNITLELMTILAGVDDHARQEDAWDAFQQQWDRSPAGLRRVLAANREIDLKTHRLGRFVPLDEYLAAGGSIRRDLLDESICFAQDVPLLRQLAAVRLQAEADRIAREEGWAFALAEIEPGGDLRARYRFIRITSRPLTEAEEAQRIVLEDERDALYEQPELTAEMHARLEEIDCQIEQIDEACLVYDPEEKARAGVYVYLGPSGQLCVDRGLIERERATPAAGAADTREHAEDNPSSEKQRSRPVHSAVLTSELTSHYTYAVRAALLEQPNVALAMIAAKLLDYALNNYDDHLRALTIGYAHRYGAVPKAEAIAESPAEIAINACMERWKERLREERGERSTFEWALTLSTMELLEMIAAGVAAQTNGVSEYESEGRKLLEPLARALNLDLTQWWVPNPDNYFGRVSKQRLHDILVECDEPEAAKAVLGMKKAEAAQYTAAKAAPRKWLPEFMRVGKD